MKLKMKLNEEIELIQDLKSIDFVESKKGEEERHQAKNC